MFAKLVSSGSESLMSNILGINCVESGSNPINRCVDWGYDPGRPF